MSDGVSRRDLLRGAAACAAAAALGVQSAEAADDGHGSVEAQTLAFIKRCALEDGGYARRRCQADAIDEPRI